MAKGWQDDPLWKFRVKGIVKPEEGVTSEQIDEDLYGWGRRASVRSPENSRKKEEEEENG